jgi:hypothetical protein
MATAEDWWLPGGAVITEDGRKLRLHPPPDWDRVILALGRVPPSMNSNQIRSHWRGFQKEKKDWQAEIGLLLLAEKARRGHYERAMAGALMRFTHRSHRDTGNYTGLVNKALGDALVVSPDTPRRLRYIPDDDEPHYHFSGVEFDAQPGLAQTRIYIYLKPKEES